MTAPDRDMVDWILAQKSVMTPLTEAESQLVARRQVANIVAEAARQYANWEAGRPMLARPPTPHPEPKPKRLGEMWGKERRHPVLGETTKPSLLVEVNDGADDGTAPSKYQHRRHRPFARRGQDVRAHRDRERGRQRRAPERVRSRWGSR